MNFGDIVAWVTQLNEALAVFLTLLVMLLVGATFIYLVWLIASVVVLIMIFIGIYGF